MSPSLLFAVLTLAGTSGDVPAFRDGFLYGYKVSCRYASPTKDMRSDSIHKPQFWSGYDYGYHVSITTGCKALTR